MDKLNLAILQHILKVQNASGCISFYENQFGMKVLSQASDSLKRLHTMLGFKEAAENNVFGDRQNAVLELVDDKSNTAVEKIRQVNHGGKEGVYWKIAVHMPDVNKGIDKLNGRGIKVGPASQFRDIGYLAHLVDPDSYTIELLQFTFEGKIEDHVELPEHPLNQMPTLGLITLRTGDIDTALKFYRDILGMKLICRQDVSVYNFVLYFLAFTDETPPNATDLDAVENREWLYQRPYTVLELQVINDGVSRKFEPVTDGAYGFMGMGFGCSDIASLQTHLESKGLKPYDQTDKHELFQTPSLTVNDPHGIPIRFMQY